MKYIDEAHVGRIRVGTHLLAPALNMDGLQAVLKLLIQPRLALRVDERVVVGVHRIGLGLNMRVHPAVAQRNALILFIFFKLWRVNL